MCARPTDKHTEVPYQIAWKCYTVSNIRGFQDLASKMDEDMTLPGTE